MPTKTLCPKCHGQRTTSCVACRGTGKKSLVDITIGICKECNGTGQRLPVGVTHNEARSGLLNGPRRWEAAGWRHWFGSASTQRPQQIVAHAAIELQHARATARAER
jgi:hypothetical protein